MNRVLVILLATALLATCVPVGAADMDGIPLGAKFPLPLQVDGQLVTAEGRPITGIGFVIPSADGEALIEVFYQKAGVQSNLTYTLKRVNVAPTPGPTPGPTPTPNPKPQPSPLPQKVSYIYFFHESGDANPVEGAVRNAKSWRDLAEKAGIVWHVWEVTEAAKAFPKSVAKAKETGLPAVLFIDKAGASVAEKAPTTVAAMDALVKQYGGIK